MTIYFEILTIELHFLYIINMYGKFYTIWMWFIENTFLYNLRLQKLEIFYLIDNIAIDFWTFGEFSSMLDIRKQWNPIVNLSKFTSNKKILSWVIAKLCP